MNVCLSRTSAGIALLLVLITAYPVGAGMVIPPTVHEAQSAIIDYYDGLGYEVRVLELGKIERVPSDRDFSGAPTFAVEIKSITLAEIRERGIAEEQTFSNASVLLQEKKDRKGAWAISCVNNIPVP